MKKSARILSFLLAMVMLLAFATACGEDTEKKKNDPERPFSENHVYQGGQECPGQNLFQFYLNRQTGFHRLVAGDGECNRLERVSVGGTDLGTVA